MSNRRALLRALPAIDRLLGTAMLTKLESAQPHSLIREAAQKVVEELRRQILDEQAPLPDLDLECVATLVAAEVARMARPSLRKVINVTGTLLHTNLGRAPLCSNALQAINEVAQGYSNLEYNLDEGQRGKRFTHVEELLCKLTGGEAATVVNNNAGAVMLALAALAGGRSALVSRGELIEIGGSFRIPDVMRLSGACLVEVGTTNKTHRRDYEGVISEHTALLLKVHRSNFEIVGFTSEVSIEELVEIGRKRGVATMMDLGSGCLLEAERLAELGLPAEPSVRAVMASGLDVVTFSGDKLLGGPQAGIILGHRKMVAAVRAHPMMRALRPDKLTLSALTATLAAYRDGVAAIEIPAVAMMSVALEDLRARAEELRRRIGAAPEWLEVSVVACESTVGGGAVPTATLPSWGIALESQTGTVTGGGEPPQPSAAVPRGLGQIEARLRSGPVPVIGRIADDQLLIDVRTLRGDEELRAVAAAVRSLF